VAESRGTASDRRRGGRDARDAALHPVDGGAPAGTGGTEPGAAESALQLDRLIHERIRLGILSALAVESEMTFSDLKRLLQTTDGNVSVHARKLEEAGYISCTKSFEGRVPRTRYAITARGRASLGRYLDHMEALIRAARER
jgi:DNA-binding transcriptional ArsR family regulator